MKVYLFLRAVSDFDVMKIQVLGYDDMSAGILEPEDGRNKLLWQVGKYLQSANRHIREHLNLDQGGLENCNVAR